MRAQKNEERQENDENWEDTFVSDGIVVSEFAGGGASKGLELVFSWCL